MTLLTVKVLPLLILDVVVSFLGGVREAFSIINYMYLHFDVNVASIVKNSGLSFVFIVTLFFFFFFFFPQNYAVASH